MTTTPRAGTPAPTRGATTTRGTAPDQPSSPDTPAVTPKDRGIVLLFLGLMVTMLLASLNQTVLSSALPTIVGELDGVEHMSWVITAFILASTITMPIYGKVSDVLGRKPLLLTAILLFMAGSVIGALAGDMNLLIVGRTVQGLGGGGLMILSQAAIADVIPARERGKYMGIMGAVFAVSSVAGPLLGGWFTEGPGWRWVFWINIPLGVVAALAAIFLLHLPKKARSAERVRHDYLGMALMAVATTALVLVGTWGGSQYAWGSATILGLIALAVVAAVAFVLVERRADEPIIPLHLFADRNFTVTTIAALATGIAMFGAIGYMPTYLQMATGASATVAGLLMIPMMGSLLVTSVVTGQMVSRTGKYKVLPIVGSLILGVGLALLSTVEADTPTPMICVFLGVIGIGLGSSMQILTLIVQNSFPLREVGTATAANNYFRQVGATLGSAVVGSVFIARLTTLLAEKFPQGTGSAGGTGSLTPDLVQSLPDGVRALVIESYNEALVPLFLYMVPLAVIAAIALCFVHEKPLATSVEHEIAAESLAEGQLLVSDADTDTDTDADGASDAVGRGESVSAGARPER
ncbi:MDR family MFS transporter [Oerskovia paurometabola]|uniref:MDR family MFS transporter n=1 Tax=Oerskovia paurometabola TaxID=162170 RepID=UPI0034420AC1